MAYASTKLSKLFSLSVSAFDENKMSRETAVLRLSTPEA